MTKSLLSFTSRHRLELLLLTFTFITGAFLRFYRIADYMTFLGDEGRDVLVIKRILIDHHPTLIGPTTSVTTSTGHMYLGPLYYYLIAIPMAFSQLNPVSAAVMVALFGLATLLLIWWTGRTWFSSTVGLLAALLYAISPTAIIYSRSSWNPNIMPFFALLAIYSIYQVWQRHRFRWLTITAIALAFGLQSHYLGLLLIPTLGLTWLLTAIKIFKHHPHHNKKFILNSGLCLLVFLVLMSPLLLFDLRHDFLNFQALRSFFTIRQTTINLKLYKALPHLWPIFVQIVGSLITAKNLILAQITAALITLTSSIYLSLNSIEAIKSASNVREKNLAGMHPKQHQGKTPLEEKPYNKTCWQFFLKKAPPFFFLLLAWVFTGIAGLGLYKQHLYDHYFGFLFPAIFLLTAWAISTLSLQITTLFSPKTSQPSNPIQKQNPSLPNIFNATNLLPIIVSAPLIYFNLIHNPLRTPPNSQLTRTRQVAQKISEESRGQPFNLAMIAKQNYDAGYRFFLKLWDTPLVAIEPQHANQTITNQLFVICENQPPFKNREEDCYPIGHPQSEIALFGWAQIANEWTFPWGTRLYRLTHYQQSPTPNPQLP